MVGGTLADGKQLRIAVVGPSCIGKTCFIKRFTENTFQGSQYGPTPGVDFMARRLILKPVGTVTLIIQDVAGAALTSKMIEVYLSGIDIFMLTYDMTNAGTLTELRKWIEVIKKVVTSTVTDTYLKPSLALVGLKGDLEHLRAVRLDGHTKFAQEFNVPLNFLCSAKSGEAVFSCFSKATVYHLNPEAAKSMSKEAPLPTPSSSSTTGSSSSKKGSSGPAKSDQGSGLPLPKSQQEPNSAVCLIQ